MATPTESSRIIILRGFRPYLCLLNAFNKNKFHSTSFRDNVYQVFLMFYTVFVASAAPIIIGLNIFYDISADVDMKEFIVVLPLLVTLFQIELIFVALIMKNGGIMEIIVRLQRVVDQRCLESHQSHRVYRHVESNYAMIFMTLFRLLFGTWISVALAAAIFRLSYAIFDYPPLQYCRLPLDIPSLLGRDNFIGFYFDWFIELVLSSTSFLIVFLIECLFIGISIYINGMVNDMETRLMLIEKDSSIKPPQSLVQLEMWSIYVDEIRFHLEIISIARSLCDIMSLVLFNIMFTCTVIIVCNLFVVEMIENINIETIVALVDLLAGVGLTFVYFYLAESITFDLLKIGDIFYNSSWYNLTNKHQKLVKLTIIRAQRELRLKGLGLFDCSLVVFLSMIRTGASYFLIIRRFN